MFVVFTTVAASLLNAHRYVIPCAALLRTEFFPNVANQNVQAFENSLRLYFLMREL
jgi:hypothetical protein